MNDTSLDGIAIVGMAGRFPGAGTTEQLWANLVAGVESISFFDDDALARAGLDGPALRRRGDYVAARGVLADADCFDAAFFGIPPKEAEVMDPQHRLFLEICWTALERAGYAPNQMSGSVGVFAGATFNTYRRHVLDRRPDLTDLVGPELVMFGNEKDYLTTRVAYKLGLRGPAVNVSTACSTSLVAVAQACQSLLTYQCDVALAGGSSVTVPQERGYFHDDGNIGSADGHTRTFDVGSSGTAFGNGVAAVVLKRLSETVEDGDRIYAVIKGAAINNDGSQRVSFGAPGLDGQADVIAHAHALADVDPETIGYVEAHGTATPLGDPIEVAALTKAFRRGTAARQFCALGSIKTNLGHLDVAAGVTGLIKVALSLDKKILPASLHFTAPNPQLDLENSPFYVNATLQDWSTRPNVPRRAGISSFGTGGTNAHLIVEQAPDLPPSGPSRPWQLLTLSARTPEALERMTSDLAQHLDEIGGSDGDAGPALADAAFTLQTGRSRFAHRRVVACRDPADGATVLAARDPKRVFTQRQQRDSSPVVFMFPGQGAQYPGMGAEIYASEPVFRAEVDRCAEILRPVIDTDLRTLLFPSSGKESEAGELLRETRLTQPALFTIEYALARLWMSWDVRPAAMIGHSVGEYVAACLAEVFSLEDALTLVARRGALVQALPGGAMLAVRLPEPELIALVPAELSIAAINSPALCVVAGSYEAIDAFERRLAGLDVVTRRLHTSHAFHSTMMEPVLEPFERLLEEVKLAPPVIPYVSNVTARWVTAADTQSVSYWASHVRQPVRFGDGVAELMNEPSNVLLEVGPGQTLSTLARQHPSKSADQVVVASLPLVGADEPRGLVETLGRLWMAGVSIDWSRYYQAERRRRAVLPTYSFERTRHWPAPATVATPSDAVVPAAVTLVAPEVGGGLSGSGFAAAPAVQGSAVDRAERLRHQVSQLLEELSGSSLAGVDSSIDLLELGFDSLLLTQAATLLQRKFAVRLSFRQLMEQQNSIAAIAEYLDRQLPPEAPAPLTPAPTAVVDAGPSMPPASGSALEQLLVQQQQLTTQLLQLMGRMPAAGGPQPAAGPAARATPTWTAATTHQASHGPFKRMDRSAGAPVSPTQTQALQSLIDRYTRRTRGSKASAARNRGVLADPRSASGFKQAWKEMVYPIVSTRSDGSRIWDVDGNEYVDFVMGFGASLFGHRPPFVVEAVREQLLAGFEIGPIQPLAGEVATLIQEFTGLDRVGFTNTGSEAVLAATRVARTVSGRDRIAVFAGAYHGIFDEVLFRPVTRNGEPRAAAIAPGIPAGALGEVVVLEYGDPQSLDYLRAHGNDIAAVLVEPVQSRRLDLQPAAFLRELREITQQTGSALVFDEVVTGFRIHPGGAQAHFGVRADLATYGKVIGGGLPIGVVAGCAKFMDALDGGAWQYGDESFPEVGVTFFAGTFVRHPLALAAARAVLTHLKQQGPGLQGGLNARTRAVAGRLQATLDAVEAPYRLTQFSSLMHLTPAADQKHAGLLFYMLRERGIHIWDNRAIVVTTAHTDEDFDRLETALKESLAEMRRGEFLQLSRSAPAVARVGADPRAALSSAFGEPTPAADANAAREFGLTHAQKEIWLAAQMGGQSAIAYNESLKLDFTGLFDATLFRDAVRQVVARYPILLASISADGERQRVDPHTQLDIADEDLSDAVGAERERRLAAVLEREALTPFDLQKGLLRVRIVRLEDEHTVVVWTAHHIVCDGWSGGLIVHELAAIYSAGHRGTSPVLEAPTPFEDYADATRADTPEVNAAAAYWREQFADLPPVLDLPTDRPRPPIRTAGASTVRLALDPALQHALKRTASQQRTTTVVLLTTAVKTLLHRLSGQTDLVIGLPVAGQAVTGNRSLVGHCVSLVPVRTRLQPDSAFRDNLALVKASVLDAYEHYQTTIGQILQHVRVPRTPDRPPLIEVIFNLDPDPGAAEFAGVTFECTRNAKQALHYDLFFNFVDGPRGLLVECDFNTDLFEASTVARWLGHLHTLLDAIASNPEVPVRDVPLLTEAERVQIVEEFNRPRSSPGMSAIPADGSGLLHELFEAQVRRSPTAVAVTCDGQSMSYAELNAAADRVACALIARGAAPDTLVGLAVGRSTPLVIGMLGILKAGAAYLPIDQAYPPERVAFILGDAGVRLLIADREQAQALGSADREVVCLDDVLDAAGSDAVPVPSRRASPDDLAYVIYTSGTTGKPKGTLITHRNVVRLFSATDPWFGFQDRDVWTLFHSCAFDFSVWEVWGALLYGGRLVVVPFLVSRSPDAFRELLANEGVTVLNQTPSAFRQLMQADESATTGTLLLRYVIFGGEALEMQSLRTWFDRHGDERPRLINMYGITETTVHVTYRPLSRADVQAGSVIGVPIPDLRIHILDPAGHPVPIGVPGEMYVGGAGLARGYLRRPDLTTERFVPDHISGRAHERLYRTGDLARFLPTQDIEYLGRIDHQVKIRGFRIELGEIESVLCQRDDVREAVVLAREDEPGNKRLVAYVVPARSSVQVDALRAHLATLLPPYMVPAAFVVLDAMPLTTNGKVDRKALKAPDDLRSSGPGETDAPQDALEQMLSQLWSQVLKVRPVGLHDNFFDLGGHSILALRLLGAIEKRQGQRLPLATLLQAPTVAQLADVIRRTDWRPSWSSLVPIRPGGWKTPLFLMHSHGGNVLEYYPLVKHLDQDLPVYALQARGLDGRIPAGATMQEMAAAYLKEITALQPEGPYYLGGFCFGGVLALEVAQQLMASGHEVRLVVLIQATNPQRAETPSEAARISGWYYRAAKRLELERQNLRSDGSSYMGERVRRVWDIGIARTAIGLARLTGRPPGPRTRQSTRYILEALGVEHDRIYLEYAPRPYDGDVVLLRASRQQHWLENDRTLGWQGLLRGRLDIVDVPGHQESMLREPNVRQMASVLTERLGSAAAGGSTPLVGSVGETSRVTVSVAASQRR